MIAIKDWKYISRVEISIFNELCVLFFFFLFSFITKIVSKIVFIIRIFRVWKEICKNLQRERADRWYREGIHIGNDDNDLLVFITLGPMAFLCFLFCIPECMMDDGSTSAIFWKQEAPVAAAEGNFDFQEIASFLPVSLFFFSANRQKENLSKRKKKEKKRIFLSHHAITADSASTARRKVHFAARQCLTHEFLHESPILFCIPSNLPRPMHDRRIYIYISKLSVYFRGKNRSRALCTLWPRQQQNNSIIEFLGNFEIFDG